MEPVKFKKGFDGQTRDKRGWLDAHGARRKEKSRNGAAHPRRRHPAAGFRLRPVALRGGPGDWRQRADVVRNLRFVYRHDDLRVFRGLPLQTRLRMACLHRFGAGRSRETERICLAKRHEPKFLAANQDFPVEIPPPIPPGKLPRPV